MQSAAQQRAALLERQLDAERTRRGALELRAETAEAERCVAVHSLRRVTAACLPLLSRVAARSDELRLRLSHAECAHAALDAAAAERGVLASELRAANDEVAAQAAQAQRLRAELQAVRAEDAAEIARLWQRINGAAAPGGAS